MRLALTYRTEKGTERDSGAATVTHEQRRRRGGVAMYKNRAGEELGRKLEGRCGGVRGSGINLWRLRQRRR